MLTKNEQGKLKLSKESSVTKLPSDLRTLLNLNNSLGKNLLGDVSRIKKISFKPKARFHFNELGERFSISPGNLKNLNLSKLWNSSLYQSLRKKHLSSKRADVKPCDRCTVV